MSTRRFKFLLSLFALAPLVAPALAASPWVEGRHYFVIKPAQPTSVGPGKVEVTEVFSYGCPACYHFYPIADKIKAALPKNAVMTYLPASWNAAEAWPLFQRAYITAQALGVADKAHNAMFRAIWESDELAVLDKRTNRLKSKLPTLEQVAAFYERTTGVKSADFIKTAKSFSVEMKVKAADNAIKALRADQTPTMVVHGKYRYTAQSAGGEAQLIELTRYLVSLESK